ncbi:MAG: metalloprotease PmbA [Methylophilaceae bacterium]|jgi:PmbA protein|nr:metalloprotease PmbA [Methylophilaceae bacterium]
MQTQILKFTHAKLSDLVDKALKAAKSNGATSAEAEISISTGKNVSVRLGNLETLEHNNDKSLTLTVYVGQRRGVASTSDFSSNAIDDCVKAACQIAKYTSEDYAFGLPEQSQFATNVKDLDLFHKWEEDESIMIEQALCCEDSALSYDEKIENSEGAQMSCSESMFVYANSSGFTGGFPSSRFSLGCSVVAKDNKGMQRDSVYSSVRCLGDLKDSTLIGHEVARRVLKRLNPKPIKTGKYAVIFEAPIATSFISSLVSAISGGNLYRETSFLLGSIGSKIASDALTILENPFLPRGNASTYFDDEGVKVEPRILVEKGVLNGYFLSTYSARRLNMHSTGNAGGAHNLMVQSSGSGLEQLIKNMGTGLIVTELLGHGVNMVTGDYSRGAAGLWVEAGEIKHAVEEITIAGNLKAMLRDVVAIGDDTYKNSSRYTGSILVSEMMIASNN